MMGLNDEEQRERGGWQKSPQPSAATALSSQPPLTADPWACGPLVDWSWKRWPAPWNLRTADWCYPPKSLGETTRDIGKTDNNRIYVGWLTTINLNKRTSWWCKFEREMKWYLGLYL
jgi:hypothetical protein